MANCENCSSCGGCSGGCPAGNSLELTAPEIEMLQYLSQIPFIAIARRPEEETPVCEIPGEQATRVLVFLERKRLITLDYDLPLKGFDYSIFHGRTVHGSAALTLRGQEILETLDRQGAAE